jgi:hypothetical protein
MKVKTLTLEGQTGFTATISRDEKSIICQIDDSSGNCVNIHHVSPNDRTDQYSMAECIQFQLDGCHGTNSMKHDYLRMSATC